jgi:hypothetical protein
MDVINFLYVSIGDDFELRIVKDVNRSGRSLL